MSKYKFLDAKDSFKTMEGYVGKKIAINMTVVPKETKMPKTAVVAEQATTPVVESVQASVAPVAPENAPVIDNIASAPVAQENVTVTPVVEETAPVVNEGPVPTMFDAKTRAVPTFGGEPVVETPVVNETPVNVPVAETIGTEVASLREEVANNDMVPRDQVLNTLKVIDEALGMASSAIKAEIEKYSEPLQNAEEEQIKLAA